MIPQLIGGVYLPSTHEEYAELVANDYAKAHDMEEQIDGQATWITINSRQNDGGEINIQKYYQEDSLYQNWVHGAGDTGFINKKEIS